jgi:diadenosine tetraphosphate (Ap4A) HIT family hydrolase
MDCLICDRIQQVKAGTNKYFVKEMETGYAVIGDHQFFRGYSLFLCKHHVHELHELDSVFRIRYLTEMSVVAEAVFRAFKPAKLNYELLGNKDPHLHWHLFPRHEDDPEPQLPVWAVDKSYRNTFIPSDAELADLKSALRKELDAIMSDAVTRA